MQRCGRQIVTTVGYAKERLGHRCMNGRCMRLFTLRDVKAGTPTRTGLRGAKAARVFDLYRNRFSG